VASRVGSFALGFAVGALTVLAFRRLKDYADSDGYEKLAESVQSHLQELEARIGASPPAPTKRKRQKAAS
jgi:hypothetical protein